MLPEFVLLLRVDPSISACKTTAGIRQLESPVSCEKVSTHHLGLSGSIKIVAITMTESIPDPAIGNLQVTWPEVNDIPNDIQRARDKPVPQ